jgi:apolipoprotein D and lipocalin family protein
MAALRRRALRAAGTALAVLSMVLMSGCVEDGGEPMETVPYVDLKRYMGDWYVVANIPTFVEKEAYNPIERYKLNPDGTIATTFTFNKGSFDGPLKTFHPKGFVLDKETNAHWGMQFIWPIKGDFRIIYLDEDYQTTVIGRAKRDYVWVMKRTPTFTDAEYEQMRAFIESVGYDASKLQRPPHETG